MAEKTPRLQRAQDFLIEQVRLGPVVKRIGLLLHARLDNGADAALSNAHRLQTMVREAADRTYTTFRSHLADFSDDTQRITMEFFFAQSNRLTAPEQVALFLEGNGSAAVAYAAARQRKVPAELQAALVEHAQWCPDAMRALAENPQTSPKTLLPLATHPSREVRIAVAAHIGPRMRIEEPAVDADKRSVFDALVDRYEDSFAPYIIPVCKDSEQLQKMFERSTMTPENAHLFTDNPYASNDILLSVVGSNAIGLLPGGRGVKERARTLVSNRLGDSGPTP
ncbi:hypothetical protein [Castellaniella sp.]|uniref:hypothetical protein n=1 Tax=Castellaniella sp. TaxID=1955812 RepID=UPI002AFDE883|nr:hypothetical protein [Castellaniella sp.]